jgi:hypothetical protein
LYKLWTLFNKGDLSILLTIFGVGPANKSAGLIPLVLDRIDFLVFGVAD